MTDLSTNTASDQSIASIEARTSAMSDRFVVRMIQACSVLMIVSTLFHLLRLYHLGRLEESWLTYSLAANLAVGLVSVALTFTKWFVRHWQPLSWTMAVMLTVTDAMLGLTGGQHSLLFISLMLNMVGTGSLLPWSFRYQASFNLVCLGAWGLRMWSMPQEDQNDVFRAVALLSAAGLAQFSCYLRITYITEATRIWTLVTDSESALRQIFDSNTDSITVTDAVTHRIVDVNAEYSRMCGYTAAETIGKTPLELDLWADPEIGKQFVRSIAAHEPIRNRRVRIRAKDGQVHSCLISAAVIKIKGRISVLSVARDIAELEAAEQKLRSSEAMLREIFDSSLDNLAIIDLGDNTVVDINNEQVRTFGFSREEAVGNYYDTFNIWVDQDQRTLFTETIYELGEVRNFKTRFRRRDGRTFPALISAVVLELAGRKRSLSIVRDITDIEAAEQKLRSSEAKLREVFDSSLDNISIVDLVDGTLVDVNNEQIRSFGYSRQELLGNRFDSFDTWVDSDKRMLFVKTLLERGKVRNFKTLFRARDGRTFPALISAVLLELDGRKRCLAIARDITDLENARLAALAASRAKSEFLSSMSHEIRTPMNAILGMADLLGESELNPEQRRYLDTVVSNGNALLEIINSILDLARVESGRLSLEAVEFDLTDLVERVAETLAVRAYEKQLELVVRIDPDLDAVTIGDTLRLRQVLTNLLGNAIKFTERGEIVVSVERNHDPSIPGNLLFSVRDTGIGIAPDKLAAVFSSFTQADASTTRKYGGSGLGLAIVERLVNLMGGRVWVDSVMGQGSTFRFTTQLPAAVKPHLELPPLADPDVRGVRVLVADDNASTRGLITGMLEAAGAIVVEVSADASAYEALEKAHRAGTAIGLMLIALRKTSQKTWDDSLKLIRRAQSLYPDAAIVMLLSTQGFTVMLAELRAMGLKDYVAKPIKQRELYAAIAEARHVRTADEPRIQASLPAIVPSNLVDRPLRLLLADDSPDNRLLINAYLKKSRYVIDQVENGQLALDHFESARYDVVLMDIQMPILDGYGAVRKMRQFELDNRRNRTPIIALTASALPEDVRRAKEAGFDLHVSKPVRKGTLLDSIASIVKADADSDAAADTLAPKPDLAA